MGHKIKHQVQKHAQNINTHLLMKILFKYNGIISRLFQTV